VSVVTTTEGVEGVENIGYKNLGEVYHYISNSIALVFPSRTESLGVPLLEASGLGVPIIAPDLDYVNSVIDNYYRYKEDDISSFESVVDELLLDISKKTVRTTKVKVEIDSSTFISNICQALR
jgi:glycosyltransferase involved in cell wall biosynthesis